MNPNFRYDDNTETTKFAILYQIAWYLDDCRQEDCPDEPKSQEDVDGHTYYSGHGPMGAGIEQEMQWRGNVGGGGGGGGGGDLDFERHHAPREEATYLNDFPKDIKTRIEQKKEYCNYGLLPEISRAWISVDQDLFLWNYAEASMEVFDIYNGSTSMITSVCLSTPKANIFHEKINYILVVATRDDLYILGIEHKNNKNGGSIQLFPSEFVTTTDDVTISKMVGTRWGKVYMIGDNSLLYELDYGYHESWISGSSYKCQKVNKSSLAWKLVNMLPNWGRNIFSRGDYIRDLKCDQARQLLYCISHAGCITVYKMDNKGEIHDAGLCSDYTVNQMVVKYYQEKSAQPPNDSGTVYINDTFITPIQESQKYNFVVVLSDGQRVYLNVDPTASQPVTPVKVLNIPSLDEISRNCGSSSINERDYKQLQPGSNNELVIHKSYYSKGVFMLGAKINGSAIGQGKNVLIVIYASHQCHKADDGSNEMVLLFDDRGAGGLLREFMNEEVKDIAEQVSYYTCNDTVAGLMMTYTLERPSFVQDFMTRDSLFEPEARTGQDAAQHFACLAPNLPGMALPRQGQAPSWGLSRLSMYGADEKQNNTVRVCTEEFLQHIPVFENIFRSFVCITDKGVHIFNKLRPADTFMRAAFARYSPDRLLQYIQHFGILRKSEEEPETNRLISPDTLQYLTNNRLRQCLVTILGCICGLPYGAGILQGAGFAGQPISSIQDTIIDSIKSVKYQNHQTSLSPDVQKKLQATIKFLKDRAKEKKRSVGGKQETYYQHDIVVDAWFVLVSRILKPVFQSRVFDSDFKEEVFSLWLSDDIVESTLHSLGTVRDKLVYFFNRVQPNIIFPVANHDEIRITIERYDNDTGGEPSIIIGGDPTKKDMWDKEKITRLHYFATLNMQFLELIRLLKPLFKEDPLLSIEFKLFDTHFLGQANGDKHQHQRSFTAQITEKQNYYMLRYVVRELLYHMYLKTVEAYKIADKTKQMKICTLEKLICERCSYFYSRGDSSMFHARVATLEAQKIVETDAGNGGIVEKKRLDGIISLWREAIEMANCTMVSTNNNDYLTYNYPIKINDFIFSDLFKSLGRLLRSPINKGDVAIGDSTYFRKEIVALCHFFFIKDKSFVSIEDVFDVISDSLIEFMQEKKESRTVFFLKENAHERLDMRVKVIIEFFEKFGGSNHSSGISSSSVSGMQSKLNFKWLEKFLGKLYESHRKSEFNFADFISKLMENPSSTSLRTSIIQCLKDLREKQESGDNDNVGTLLKSLRVCYKCLGHHLHEASNIMYHAAMDESKNIRIDVRLEYLEYAEQDARQYQNGIVGRSRLSMILEDNDVQHARIQLDTFKAAESAGFIVGNNIIDRLRDQILWKKESADLMQIIYDLKCFSTWELLLRIESLNPVPNRNYCRNLWAAILHQECFRDVSKPDRDLHDNNLTTALASVGFGYLLNTQTLKNMVAPIVFVGLRSAVPPQPALPNQIYLKYATHHKYLPETSTGYGASRDMLLPNRLHKVIDDIIRKDGVRVTFDNRSILRWLVTILASEEYPTDWCTSAITINTQQYSQLQSLQRNCRSAKAFIMHLPQEIETSGIMTKKQMAHILKDPNFYPFQTQPSAEWRMVWLYLLYNCDERLAAKKEFDDFEKNLNNLPAPPSFKNYGVSLLYNQPNTYVLQLMYNDATNW